MKTSLLAVVLGLLLMLLFAATAFSFPEDPPGKVIFKTNKCNSCHTITAQGIKKGEGEEAEGKKVPDLSPVGTKHDAAWMSKYLLKKEKLNDEKHLKKFKGSDEDLETLTNWLATLKSK